MAVATLPWTGSVFDRMSSPSFLAQESFTYNVLPLKRTPLATWRLMKGLGIGLHPIATCGSVTLAPDSRKICTISASLLSIAVYNGVRPAIDFNLYRKQNRPVMRPARTSGL